MQACQLYNKSYQINCCFPKVVLVSRVEKAWTRPKLPGRELLFISYLRAPGSPLGPTDLAGP